MALRFIQSYLQFKPREKTVNVEHAKLSPHWKIWSCAMLAQFGITGKLTIMFGILYFYFLLGTVVNWAVSHKVSGSVEAATHLWKKNRATNQIEYLVLKTRLDL